MFVFFTKDLRRKHFSLFISKFGFWLRNIFIVKKKIVKNCKVSAGIRDTLRRLCAGHVSSTKKSSVATPS